MADSTYQRYKNLYDEKVITKQEFDQYTTQKNVAQLQYQQAQAGVQQARAGLGEVKVFQSYARVTAPVSGIVTQRNIDLGSTAIQGQPMLTIEAPGEAELVANIDESYLDKVKEGEEVSLEINGKTIKRKITKVVKHIDPMTRTFKVKIDITNLAGGQFAKINIPVAKKDAITVPKSAIVEKGELTGVYTVDSENVISYRLIRTGKTYGDKVEVLSGLSDGDKIITVGVEKAIDGGQIDVK
jgi:RND family efflux transporter MFP subunit